MTLCRFEVVVPNPGPGAVDIELSLEKGSMDELGNLGFPRAELLEIVDAGITFDPCEDGGERRVDLKLGPLESTKVYVVVDVAGGPGAALLHLVDRRGDETGGVMLACFEGIDADPAGTVVQPEQPCPIELAGPIYACLEDAPGQEDPDGIIVGGWSWIAVPLVNVSSDVLPGAFGYVEHLGGADADFDPGTWQMGDLAPGEKFLAVWRVRVDSARVPLGPCIVVGSDKTDPVRIGASVGLWERKPWEPGRADAFDRLDSEAPLGRRPRKARRA